MKKPFQKNAALISMLMFVVVMAGCQIVPGTATDTQQTQTEKVDDWAFDPQSEESDRAFGLTGMGVTKTSMPMMAMEASRGGSGNIGLSVGGAKDINNFRENIENGYLPIPSDITVEGLFYNYFFDTGAQAGSSTGAQEPSALGGQCKKLFCPSYSSAVSKDPFSKEDEYYLSVGLNSGIKESDFQRKKLNLVLVLDISGSMGSSFDQYYYDRFGNEQKLEDSEESGKTKMEIASKAVVTMLDHLSDDDHFGMVVFDDTSAVAKPLSLVGDTDMKAIKDHILELQERGGTNMDAGMEEGTEMFNELKNVNQSDYENRIIFITDAMPNRGETTKRGLVEMAEENAEDRIYTTFIGVGVDFNTELVEAMTKIRGANYYSVHSAKEFEERMDKWFDYMVTPLVFNLELKLEADGYEIEKVYGSPEADEATGQIMKVNTLFPSETEDGETRGGLVLLKLKKTGEAGRLNLKVSYEDRNGGSDSSEELVRFEDKPADYYANNGIHKGILLARYANLMKAWLIDEYRDFDKPLPGRPIPIDCGPIILRDKAIIIPEPPHIPPCVPYPQLGQWERQSDPLEVSSHYREIFADFAEYFESEMEAIGDETLKQELEILAGLKEV
ncbi:MAG TPA: VWA domain-containing protein [Candidatus Gracilibacteria bacterium]|nr:VWA domain-containing protein [Candidatus Gracilibacteria bacterium]